MPEIFDAWPMWTVFAFFWMGATVRGQVFYWIGRVVTAKLASGRIAHDSKLARWVDGPGVRRGIELMRTWGVPAIPACYLTVGIQTLILTGAGVLRISWPVFSLAQIPGTLAWAAIYSTIGWAAWEAAVFGVARSPVGTAIIAAAIVGLIVFIGVRRRARRRGQPAN